MTFYKQQGAMTIEALFVFPIFMSIVFSGIELSRGLLIKASLNNTLAEAARAIKLEGSKGDFQTLIRDLVNRNADSLIDSSLIKVTKSKLFYCPAQLATGSSCSKEQRQNIPPIARFEVSYDFKSLSPLGILKFNSSIIVKYEQK